MTSEVIAGAIASDLVFPAISDWEAAYSNRRAIPEVHQWLTKAAEAAAAFGASFKFDLDRDIVFGPSHRERLDIFHTESKPKGTLVFIHGGYWRASAKESHWHFAKGPLSAGWRVAFVEYPLCPQVSIRQICQSIKRAVEYIAAALPEDRLVVSGHSAGGHLATWLGSDLSGLDQAVMHRIDRVVSYSGLHDLRPLVGAAQLNADLRLDLHEARQLSPALSSPAGDFELICIAGEKELPEFRRQNVLQANLWNGLGLRTRAIEIAQANHYTLLDGLCSPDSSITALLG